MGAQAGEVLRSWAVPKGPSLDPAVRRLAVPVEDHELSAGEFEGVHEGHLRGSGAVIIWDEGPAEVTRGEPGQLVLTLHGSKLTGPFLSPAPARTSLRNARRACAPEGHGKKSLRGRPDPGASGGVRVPKARLKRAQGAREMRHMTQL